MIFFEFFMKLLGALAIMGFLLIDIILITFGILEQNIYCIIVGILFGILVVASMIKEYIEDFDKIGLMNNENTKKEKIE